MVSILVLVEVVREVEDGKGYGEGIVCFNPCFGGSGSGRKQFGWHL